MGLEFVVPRIRDIWAFRPLRCTTLAIALVLPDTPPKERLLLPLVLRRYRKAILPSRYPRYAPGMFPPMYPSVAPAAPETCSIVTQGA